MPAVAAAGVRVASRVLLLTLASLSIALAGCTIPTPGGDTPIDLGSQLDNAGAKTLIDQAVAASATGKHGFAMKAEKGGQIAAEVTSGADPAAGVTLMTMKGKPEFFSDPDDDPNGGQSAGMFATGFTIYATKTGSVMHANKTAYAFTNEGSSSTQPDPSKDATEAFDAKEILGDIKNGTVKSVKLVAHKGKAAAEIVVDTKDENNQAMTLTVTVYRDPARVAKVTGTNPGDPKKPNDPWKGATMTMDFLYDSEVTVTPSEAILRAAALAYKSQDQFAGAGPKQTWTFAGTGGIALTEVEVHAKTRPPQSSGDNAPPPPEPDKTANLWTMKLSDKTKSQDGTTVTFTDKDNDGKVSKGDTLVIEMTGSNPPMLVLFDAKTGTYVLPAGGLVAALAALLVAGIVLRRR